MAKKDGKGELVNTSELARRSGLQRAAVREKLEGKGIQPRDRKGNETLYDADEALLALQADDRSGLRRAQTAKAAAEAARARIKLDKERGQLVPIQEVRADIQAIANEIRLHFLTRAQALAPRLRGQKVARIEALPREDAEQFFAELRAGHEGYLSEQAED
jgi:hypothetical protein